MIRQTGSGMTLSQLADKLDTHEDVQASVGMILRMIVEEQGDTGLMMTVDVVRARALMCLTAAATALGASLADSDPQTAWLKLDGRESMTILAAAIVAMKAVDHDHASMVPDLYALVEATAHIGAAALEHGLDAQLPDPGYTADLAAVMLLHSATRSTVREAAQ